MSIINSDEQLKEFLCQEKVYIYGAGRIAKAVFNLSTYKEVAHIKGVIVTGISSDMAENSFMKEVSDASLQRDIPVLILTGKPHKAEMENALTEEGFCNRNILSDEYEEELNRRIQAAPEWLSIDVGQYIERINPRERLKALIVNICNHCNLNCRGCDHFSPIADEEYNSVNEIESDLARMRTLLYDEIDTICVMGGEPLLHPELPIILSVTRTIFPKVPIWLSTNGIALLNQTEEFWECCRGKDIIINVTKYPVAFDYDKAEELAKEHGVKYMYYHGGLVEKTLGHYPLDLQGAQEPEENFMRCFHANNECNMLNHGRLYPCTIAPCIPIFNKKYGCNIPLTEEDGIDIYKVPDKEILFEKLSKPMRVCKYCDVNNRTFGHPWGQSNKCLNEWS